MNIKFSAILILIISLVLSGCGQGQEATLILPISVSPTFTKATAEAIHTPLSEAVDLVAEAFSYSQQGEDEKAIATYTKAIEADPLFGQPYINRGAVYADIGELKKALADFNKGLDLDPTNLRGYTNRAQAYIQLDKLDEALADIKSVVNLTDDDEYVKTALSLGGSVYEIRGETFLALAAYSKALEIDEFFIPALIARGQIYFHQEDWLRAFSDLTLALQTTKDPGIQQAIVNILMGVYPEGTTADEAATAAKVYYDQAMKHKDSGDYQSSVDALSKAIVIDPLNFEFYFQRGLDLADLGKMEQAITDMSYVIALTPLIPGGQGYYFRGHFEDSLGMVSEAIADLEKALELEISSQLEEMARQKLESLRRRLETCQMTEFKVVNDSEKPTFAFRFIGPSNTDFIVAALSRVTGAGTAMQAKTPQNGIVPTGIEYELAEGEPTPIELDIKIRAGDCQLRKTAIWPSVDILALLSGLNPIPTFTPVAEIIQGSSPIALAGISNIYMANDAEGKNNTTTFVPTDVIYVFFDINQVESGARFQIKWFALNVNGQDPTEPFLVTDYTYAGEPTIYAQIESTDGGFPVAQYKVEIYLDGAKVGKHQFIVQ